MMPLVTFFENQLKVKDWLAFGTLFFDGGYVIDVHHTRGYVAYSPQNDLFFAYTAADSTSTEHMEAQYIMMDPDRVGMQQMITVSQGEQLFHFDFAQYCHYRFYTDEQKKTPWPKIPTRAEIMACAREDTGNDQDHKFSGATHEASMYNRHIESGIDLFPDFKDELKTGQFSAARIFYWQRFYKNQEKFRQVIQDQLGITDCM